MESVTQGVSSSLVRKLAAEIGFALSGVVRVTAAPDFDRFRSWADRGLAGEMTYLTDRRGNARRDLNNVLPGVKSLISLGYLYEPNGPVGPGEGRMAAYAAGENYHSHLKRRIDALAARLLEHADFEWRACVDTAPILERSFGREAGLGWIGKNTCLINQELGSFFQIGELLTTLEITPDPVRDTPPPDRCGTCSRCIDACPTKALVPSPDGRFELDARLCISYFTIELRGPIPEEQRAAMGNNVFGCDICQDVCPWNEQGQPSGVPLEVLTEPEYRARFRQTAVSRAKYGMFLRNVAVAMGNSGRTEFREPLTKMAESEDAMVAEHARWALLRLPFA